MSVIAISEIRKVLTDKSTGWMVLIERLSSFTERRGLERRSRLREGIRENYKSGWNERLGKWRLPVRSRYLARS